VPRDRASEIEIDEVVERFRASTVPLDTEPAAPPTSAIASPIASPITGPITGPITSSAPVSAAPPTTELARPIATLVEPGVYVYGTSGFESIDALSGVRHDYPAETTITVIVEGCGVLLRWDALQERSEEFRLCLTPAGIELQTQSLQYHEFFDQETPETVVCDVPVLLVPVVNEPPEPVAQICTIEDRPWLPVWEVLEPDVRDVDGESVDVRHVRMTIDDNDHNFEHYVADWLLAPSGLPIELSVLKQSRSSSVVGDVVYDEVVELALVSVDPLR